MAEESKALAEQLPQPAAPLDPKAQALAAVFGGQDTVAYYTFDPTSKVGKVLMDKCEEAPDAKLRELANLRFNLAHFYGHMIELTHPETGEVSTALRTCLISDDGKVYACVSEGVRRSVVRLCRQNGLPPWKVPVPVVVKLKSLPSGHNWLTVLNDTDPDPKGRKS